MCVESTHHSDKQRRRIYARVHATNVVCGSHKLTHIYIFVVLPTSTQHKILFLFFVCVHICNICIFMYRYNVHSYIHTDILLLVVDAVGAVAFYKYINIYVLHTYIAFYFVLPRHFCVCTVRGRGRVRNLLWLMHCCQAGVTGIHASE